MGIAHISNEEAITTGNDAERATNMDTPQVGRDILPIRPKPLRIGAILIDGRDGPVTITTELFACDPERLTIGPDACAWTAPGGLVLRMEAHRGDLTHAISSGSFPPPRAGNH